MKKNTTRIFNILAMLLLVASTSLFAQQNESSTQKKSCEKSCAKAIIQELKDVKGEKVDVIISTENGNVHFTSADEKEAGEMIMFVRKAKSRAGDVEANGDFEKEFEQFRVFASEEMRHMKTRRHDHEGNRVKSKRPILGIYVDNDDGAAGLKVSNAISGKGAAAAGLQSGDIITKVNNTTTDNIADLRIALNKFKPGDEVSIEYTRNGQSTQTELLLSESSDWSYERDPCKVFIGIQNGYGNAERGVGVSKVIEGWPADKAGMQVGDIVLALDGITVNSHRELVAARDQHNPGDYFTLSVLRDEQEIQVEAQFRTCEETNLEEVKVVKEETLVEEIPVPAATQPDAQTDNTLQLEAYEAFPNPTFGKVTLEFKANDIPTVIQVVDVTGKVVYKEELMHFTGYYKKELNLQHANPGTLILHIIQEEKVVSKKVILMARA